MVGISLTLYDVHINRIPLARHAEPSVAARHRDDNRPMLGVETALLEGIGNWAAEIGTTCTRTSGCWTASSPCPCV